MTEVKTTDVPETVETRSILGVRERRDALGVSRTALAQLTGFTPAVIWRCEDGRPKIEEMAKITEVLDGVEKDGLPEHLRRPVKVERERKPAAPAKAILVARLAKVGVLLEEAMAAKTVKETKALIEQAQVIVAGNEVPADEPAEQAEAAE
ncbi:helix-turn-helix domain-containing protein [Micromonospora sp. C72]|uniref:helix-turn-helix domain-containing protein n=1 Tax=Micromonospora sp. C72 TaxID=2824880 RepID=UPI001B36CD66|nr:helix-turn-helix transcriptional regulator [Micromonospora sp. C72]MBQ1042358.1 helix-turn-helix domain-containing protein [Micromonospora sp. C72]